jgi:hypothetical protein
MVLVKSSLMVRCSSSRFKFSIFLYTITIMSWFTLNLVAPTSSKIVYNTYLVPSWVFDAGMMESIPVDSSYVVGGRLVGRS